MSPPVNSTNPIEPRENESIFDHAYKKNSLLSVQQGKLNYDLSFIKYLQQTLNDYGFADILKSEKGCMLDIPEILQILV